MNEQKFTLQPFLSVNSLPNVQITGNITRNDHRFAIYYQLIANLNEIDIPLPSDTPIRKHELWQDTCFEFFVGIKDSRRYWEFNLSPAGDWNVYRFDDYRQGMQEEIALTNLPFNVELQTNILVMNLDVDLAPIISSDQAIDVAITTVVKQKNSHITYWALAHQGAEADFHLRDSFLILL